MITPASPLPIRWYTLRQAQGRRDALVAVLARPQDLPFARTLAARWGQAVPHCHFVAGRADFHTGRAPAPGLGASLGAKLRRLKVAPAQTILIGVGEAARCAFDLVVFGGLVGLGAILVDIPVKTAPVFAAPVPPTMGAALRLLRQDGDGDPDRRDFDAMLHALRQAAIDYRTMSLPQDPDAVGRAIGGFLIELVARASWHRSLSPSSPESQS